MKGTSKGWGREVGEGEDHPILSKYAAKEPVTLYTDLEINTNFPLGILGHKEFREVSDSA